MTIPTSPARFSLILLVILTLAFSIPSHPVSAVEKLNAQVLPAAVFLPAAPTELVLATFLPLVSNELHTGAFPRDHYSWRLTGPNGGTATAIVIDPQFPDNLYTGTVGMGVFVSRNGGGSWQAYNIGLTNRVIQSLAADPVNSGTVYAGTYGNGVFKSTDFGQTWQPTGPGLNADPIVYGLAVHPVQPDILFAGTRTRNSGVSFGGGVYKSTDGGASWRPVNTGMFDDWVYDIAIDPTNPSQIYLASHAQSVFKSSTTGETWGYAGNTNVPRNTRTVVVNPKNNQIVYVGSWGGDSNIMKSGDGGVTWMIASSGIRGEKVLRLAIDPNNPDTVYACVLASSGYTGGIYKTTNAGASWVQVGMNQLTVYGAAVNPLDPNKIYAATQPGGVFKSTNGGNSFFEANYGLTTATVTSAAVDPVDRDRLYLATLDRGMFRSTDGGVNWQPINSGIPAITYVLSIAIDPTSPWVLYAGTDGHALFKSLNGGDSWAPARNGMFPGLLTVPGPESPDETPIPLLAERLEKYLPAAPEVNPTSVLAVLVDPAHPQILYAGTPEGTYKSTDGAANWNNMGPWNITTYDLKFAPGSTSTIYAVTSNGLFRSSNSGASWGQTGLAGAKIYALALASTSPMTLFASVEGQGLLRSTDEGASWTPLADGLSNQVVTALVVDPLDQMTVFAGTIGGLFRSGNQGDFWARVYLDNFDQQINGLAFRPGSPVSLIGGSSFHGSFVIDFY